MDVLIGYFDADDNKIKTRYIDSWSFNTYRFTQRIQQGFERSL